MNATAITIVGALLSGGFLQWASKPIWRRITDTSTLQISREEHIALLRKALDKSGIRFNGVVSVCDLLIIALELVEQELPPAAERAKQQAKQKLSEVIQTLEKIGEGPIDG